MTSAAALFAALEATWPAAETRRLGPWTLRRGAGGGNRVSAATLDGPLADLDAAEAAMRAWGQRPLAMIRPGQQALDAALAARGWDRADASTILAAPAAALAPATRDDAVADCEAPLACMAPFWTTGGVGPERLAVMARAAGPRTWLIGRSGQSFAAVGFVAARGRVAMLHALHVAPEARRRGVGAQMTRAAAAWALDRGAVSLALAVTQANAPACALYARLGMEEAARYHYRRAPAT